MNFACTLYFLPIPPKSIACTVSGSRYEVSSCLHILNTFWSYAPDKNYAWKTTKGNNQKIMMGRVIILVHCTSEQDISMCEVSRCYLKYFLINAPDELLDGSRLLPYQEHCMRYQRSPVRGHHSTLNF